MSTENSFRFVEEANLLDKVQVGTIGDAVLSFLIAPNSTNFQEQLAEISTEHNVTPIAAKTIAQGLLLTFQEALNNGYSLQRINERLIELNLKNEIITILCKVWRKHSVNIATTLLSKAVTNNELIDLDWIFGVTASSNDCDHISKTFLQLKLVLKNTNNQQQTIVMELTLEQFYQFLASMEKCKAYLDYVAPVSDGSSTTTA